MTFPATLRRSDTRNRNCVRPLTENLEQRALFAVVAWDGGAGSLDWHSKDNWSNNLVPTANDDVTIDIPGSLQTINAASANVSVKSLLSKEGLSLGVVQFSIGALSSMEAGTTLTGKFINGPGELVIKGNASFNSLQLAPGGRITVAAGGTLAFPAASVSTQIRGVIRNDGAITWGNIFGGLYGNGASIVNNGTFTATTIPGYKLEGYEGAATFINSGTVNLNGFSVKAEPAVAFTMTNNGTLNVSGGTSEISARLTGAGTINVASRLVARNVALGSGATLKGPGVFHFPGTATRGEVLVLNGTGSIILSPSINLSSWLTLNTDRFSLAFDYTGASSLIAVQNAYINGTLVSADSVESNSTVLAVYSLETQGTTSFAGTTLDSTVVVAKFTFAGDTNVDGVVNEEDYGVVDATFGQPNTGPTEGDTNYDGVVNEDDYGAIDANFGAGGVLATRAGVGSIFSGRPVVAGGLFDGDLLENDGAAWLVG